VKSVRVGKLVEIDLGASDAKTSEPVLRAMCEKLLANPVIEDFTLRTL
jgi:phosphoribosylformylglycinamidine synthase